MITFIVITLTCALLLYIWMQRRYRYWKDRGISYIEPAFFIGGVRFDRHFVYRTLDAYMSMKGKPVYGNYNFIAPVLHIVNPDLIKNVLVKDFNYFTSRGAMYNGRDDPISEHLFSMDGNKKWKNLRAQLTPTFSSGKMKYMFPTLVTVAERLFNVLCTKLETESEIEMQDLLARFTTDIIGTVAFGLECNSLTEPDSKFREIGIKIFTHPKHPTYVLNLMMLYPNLVQLFKIKVIPDDVSEYFSKAVHDTVKYRTENNVTRKDFMDLLIKLRNDNKSNSEEDADKEGLSMNEITAQAFVFFFAGFETSSTAISFTLYELAQNETVQEKARQNVKEALARHDGKITYEALQEMAYLNQCLDEGVRKYPPLPVVFRKVGKPYQIPRTNCTLEKGNMVIIPIYSLHHDPEYFPDPEVFNPDNFSEEKVNTRHPFCYLPFGEGPRNCIGMRFGLMQARLGLAILLNNFRFKLSPRTPVPIIFKKDSFILTSKEGLHFIVEKID